MSAFEVVLIVVAVVGIALAGTRFFRTRNTVSRLGRSSFEHPEDRPVSERPNEDTRDQPLPKRSLRARY
jgi:hypothetical protein